MVGQRSSLPRQGYGTINMFSVIFGIMFFAGVAMTVREGLWSNTLTLINILICGLVAFGFYPPLATWIDEQLSGQYTYVVDFALVWGIFILAMIICRLLTRMASATRMRFRHPIDPVGGPLVGAMAAWVLASFAAATLYMAPMPKDAFGDRLKSASEILSREITGGYEMGQYYARWPDLVWLGFVEKMSGNAALGPPRGTSSGDSAFSRKGFLTSQLVHREKFDKATTSWLGVKR
jgi:hypothetical protein